MEPSLELSPQNLITLCMSPKECHLRIGHGGSFKAFSPTVVQDASVVLADPTLFDKVASDAELHRLPNSPEEAGAKV